MQITPTQNKFANNFKQTIQGAYYDLHLQSDTLMLADIFENFWNMCLEVYELDPAHFLSAPELVWQAALKKTKVNLDLLSDINMSLL